MKNIDTHQQSTASAYDSKNGPKEQGMKINGLQQVVDLLQHADPAFRESLLKRLTQRDPQLAQNLRKIIR
jgi:flagellar motor switch protein FliG